MALGHDLREGWRLFVPYAREVVTPPRRRTLVTTVVVLGMGGAALFHALVPGFETEGARILVSFAVGLAAAAIAAWIELFRWRPAITESQNFGGSPSFTPEADKEILAAYRAGREPNVSVSDRIVAAERAGGSREGVCRVILTLWPGPMLFAAYLAAATGLLIDSGGRVIGAFGGFVGFLFFAVNLPTMLALLGRTTAPIATRPEGEAEPELKKSRKPYRALGTDHPDDYS
ncbi:hypothetical protein [Frondihabitans sp. Leaf304]|uniref:hypothetical protein n=1 Tax=Frondihabitans sp. Leaf304 TaxID=1736329 RepID=UPI0006F58F5E|nr:hypothetical protein [Frondihabitans sp. Leaf304]KQQ26506.1 hypothetical protein ASF54_10760 [Frondihabitans sp. Leaf304]